MFVLDSLHLIGFSFVVFLSFVSFWLNWAFGLIRVFRGILGLSGYIDLLDYIGSFGVYWIFWMDWVFRVNWIFRFFVGFLGWLCLFRIWLGLDAAVFMVVCCFFVFADVLCYMCSDLARFLVFWIWLRISCVYLVFHAGAWYMCGYPRIQQVSLWFVVNWG